MALRRRVRFAIATLRHMSAPIELPFETLSWRGGLDGHVRMTEQTLLPLEEKQIEVRSVPEMVDAIWRLAVRGAPAIGVAAGFGMVLGIREPRRAMTCSKPPGRPSASSTPRGRRR